MSYDVVIVGGGPGGLSAALALGRARKRVLLCDSGHRRNAAAVHLHNFVTRDGTPPPEFRRIGREQLLAYPNVEVRDERVDAIRGERDRFEVALESGAVLARRVILCTGMIDVVPGHEGFAEHWGHSIFQCPYCHGWEVRDRPLGVYVPTAEMIIYPLLVRGWTSDLVAFTDGLFEVTEELAGRLAKAGIRLDERKITRLVGEGGQLDRIEFAEGPPVRLDALFAKPPQKQVPLVESLGLALDPAGFVAVDETRRETSILGIYAGGDLVTPMQSAIGAAASAVAAAAMLNHELTIAMFS